MAGCSVHEPYQADHKTYLDAAFIFTLLNYHTLLSLKLSTNRFGITPPGFFFNKNDCTGT